MISWGRQGVLDAIMIGHFEKRRKICVASTFYINDILINNQYKYKIKILKEKSKY